MTTLQRKKRQVLNCCACLASYFFSIIHVHIMTGFGNYFIFQPKGLYTCTRSNQEKNCVKSVSDIEAPTVHTTDCTNTVNARISAPLRISAPPKTQNLY